MNARTLDYQAQVTWHKTQPASLFKRKEHHKQIICKSFVLILEAKQRKKKSSKSTCKSVCNSLFRISFKDLPVCAISHWFLLQLHPCLVWHWVIWINSLPYIQPSVTITLPYTDRTAVIIRISCHNIIHKHAHMRNLHIHQQSPLKVCSYLVCGLIIHSNSTVLFG